MKAQVVHILPCLALVEKSKVITRVSYLYVPVMCFDSSEERWRQWVHRVMRNS